MRINPLASRFQELKRSFGGKCVSACAKRMGEWRVLDAERGIRGLAYRSLMLADMAEDEIEKSESSVWNLVQEKHPYLAFLIQKKMKSCQNLDTDFLKVT